MSPSRFIQAVVFRYWSGPSESTHITQIKKLYLAFKDQHHIGDVMYIILWQKKPTNFYDTKTGKQSETIQYEQWWNAWQETSWVDGLGYAHLWKKWDTNTNASFGS